MRLQDILSKFSGVVERAEKALPAAETVAGLNLTIEKLKADLGTAVSANQLSIADNSKLTAEVASLKTELATVKASVSEFDAKVEKAASIKSAAIAASQGIPPVKNLPKDGAPKVEGDKPLKGLKKVEAAWRASELAQSQTK